MKKDPDKIDLTENEPPESYQSAGSAVFDDLKNRIIRGEYLPGDRLPSERKLIEIYNRSRPTVREALRMLDRAGFIKIIPRKAAVVLEYSGSGIERPITEAIEASYITLSEIKDFRMVIEGTTAEWAALRRTDEDVRQIHNCLIQMKESVNDYEAFLLMDVDFHLAIAKACKNRTCEIILSSISDISRNFTRKNMATKSARARRKLCNSIYDLHLAIYEKIRDRDPAGAREAMLLHLTVFEKTVSKSV